VTEAHEPVLLQEIVEFLRPNRSDGTLVDATVGLGGHAEALLQRYPAARLIAIDRDPRALDIARGPAEEVRRTCDVRTGTPRELIDILKQSRVAAASGVLADLGVSSMQFDDASRASRSIRGPLTCAWGPMPPAQPIW